MPLLDPFSALFSTTQPPLSSPAVLSSPRLLKPEACCPQLSEVTAGVFGKCFHLVALWRNDWLGNARLHPCNPAETGRNEAMAPFLLALLPSPRLNWGTQYLCPALALPGCCWQGRAPSQPCTHQAGSWQQSLGAGTRTGVSHRISTDFSRAAAGLKRS